MDEFILDSFEDTLLKQLEANLDNIEYLRGMIITYMVTLEVHLDFFTSCILFGGIDSDRADAFRKFILQAQFSLARKIDLIRDLIIDNNPPNIEDTKKWLSDIGNIKNYRDRLAHGQINNFDLMQDASLDVIITTMKKGKEQSVTLAHDNLVEIVKSYVSCIKFYAKAKDNIESYFGLIAD